MNSRTSRDLPTPAPPSTVTIWQVLSRTACPSAASRTARWRSRPTKGDSKRRARPGAWARTSTTVRAWIVSPCLSTRGPLGSTATRSRTSRCVDPPIRISFGGRRLLEPLGDGDDLAGDEQVSLRVVAGDHLAGVDADAVGQADAPAGLEVAIENGERVAHLDRRPHRAQRVVLVHGRHAEHGHDRVADVLLDDPAMPSDDGAHLAEVAPEQVAQRLRVEREAEPRRVDEVGEQDRDGLAHVRRRFEDARFHLRRSAPFAA